MPLYQLRSGGGDSGVGNAKVEIAAVGLGSQDAGRLAFTYFELPGVGARAFLTRMVVETLVGSTYDLVLRNGPTDAATLFLSAVNVGASYDISTPVYLEGDANGSVWLGVKNKGSAARTFTLSQFRAEKFA